MVHKASEYIVAVTTEGRMMTCEVEQFVTYEEALTSARKIQAEKRAEKRVTAIVNMCNPEDKTPFDMDAGYSARNGVCIEIIPGRMTQGEWKALAKRRKRKAARNEGVKRDLEIKRAINKRE